MCLALTHIRNYEDFEMPYVHYTDIFYCAELKKIILTLSECMLDGPVTVNIVEILSLLSLPVS